MAVSCLTYVFSVRSFRSGSRSVCPDRGCYISPKQVVVHLVSPSDFVAEYFAKLRWSLSLCSSNQTIWRISDRLRLEKNLSHAILCADFSYFYSGHVSATGVLLCGWGFSRRIVGGPGWGARVVALIVGGMANPEEPVAWLMLCWLRTSPVLWLVGSVRLEVLKFLPARLIGWVALYICL